MYTLILVKPQQLLLGAFPSYEEACNRAAASAIMRGNIEVWIFGPDGKRVA